MQLSLAIEAIDPRGCGSAFDTERGIVHRVRVFWFNLEYEIGGTKRFKRGQRLGWRGLYIWISPDRSPFLMGSDRLGAESYFTNNELSS